MAAFRQLVKKIIPPVLIDIFRMVFPRKEEKTGLVWEGPISSWDEAVSKSSGYDQKLILEKCKAALLMVKNGEAVYERDSVVFDEIQYSWPLLSSLQKIAMENQGSLTVLDFGGSLGSSYFQNRGFLDSLNLRWCIVEQPHFVETGKKYFEDERLKFYYTIEDCLSENRVQVVLLSSVLQYLPHPYAMIEELVSFKIPYLIIDRTAVVPEGDDFIAVQYVPEEIYSASYPCHFFGEENLLKAFRGYEKLASFDSGFTAPYAIRGQIASWLGYLLKRSND